MASTVKNFSLCDMNSAIGMAWVSEWCETCYRRASRCRILTLAYAIPDVPELIYDENDNPVCTKYKFKGDHVVKHRENKEQETLNI